MKTILLSAFMLSISVINAQDIITKLDSSKLQTTILEITPTEITCKLYNYSDGPLIRLLKTEIAYVIYRNGNIEHFNNHQVPKSIDYNSAYGRYNNYIEEDLKKDEKLYTYKNYIGFNHMAFLNNCLGINYMRDVKQLNLIVNIPLSFGYDKPIVTNSLYRNTYIDGGYDEFNYTKLNYQFGLSPLFTTNMTRSANFLVGPSFLFTSFNVNTTLNYNIPSGTSALSLQKTFTNDFKLYRKNYGINVGFMARFTERFNMTMLITLGYKVDSYNEKDPFGIDFVHYQGGSTNKGFNTNSEYKIYANYMWTLGYRF